MTTVNCDEAARLLARSIHGLGSERARPILVLVSGWAATGKTTLAQRIRDLLNDDAVGSVWISTDSYLIPRAERKARGLTGYNPATIDAHGLAGLGAAAKSGDGFHAQAYDPQSGTRTGREIGYDAPDVLILEGVQAFLPDLMPYGDLTIGIQAMHADMRDMRIAANLKKSKLDSAEASKWLDLEMAEFRHFLEPSIKRADVVLTVNQNYEYEFARPSCTHIAPALRPGAI